MAYQYPLNGGRINASVGGNSTSAGAGYQLVSTGTLMLAGGNNVTLQQNANSISISGLSYADSNGVSFGINAGTLTASVNAAQSVQTIGGYATGNTTGQSSSSTFDARSLSVSAMGGASAGYSGGMLQVAAPVVSSLSQTGIISLSQNGNTISIGAPAFSAGMSTGGNSTGTAGTVSNQIIFAGGNNVTLSQSTGAGGNTLSIAGPSLSNSNGFTFGTNGSVVTASYAGGDASVQTLNYYQNMDRGTTATLAVPLANSLMLQRLNQENDLFAGNITANTVLLNMTANLNSTATTAHTVSAYIGIYTDNATNLSLLNSASTSWGLAGGNNTSVYNGPRWLSFVASQWSSAPVFTQGGDYVFGILMKSSSFAPPLSYFGQNYMISNQRSGYIGASIATNTSMAQGNFWNAILNTAALPSSINSTQVNRNNASAIFMPHIILNNRYSSL